jgi:two-component system, cell cycle response regulator
MRTEHNTALSTQVFPEQDDTIQAQRVAARQFCRVLVVDDDDLVRARLVALLEAARYQVEEAATGDAALRVLDTTQCHIVLTDWQMPDMDGLELCREVRLRLSESYVYVLMLTVRDTDGDMLKGLAAGADDYMVKGAPLEHIVARMEIGRRITRGSQSRTNLHESHGLSYSDPITDAHSLGYFLHHLPREFERSQRSGHSIAILTCNINGRRRDNEPLSLEPSDDVLRSFVTGVKGCIRKADWIARTGHNIFMIVLPETTDQGAQCVATKLTRFFSLHPASPAGGPFCFTPNVQVTAVAPQHGLNGALQINALLRIADRLSYIH